MNAPLDNTVAEGPEDAQGFWLHADDDTRLRAGLWNQSGPRGTVFLFPGRTEYVEKYGRTATDLARAGFATLTIDWRGQGMSDRALTDPMVGHVTDFAEYQKDLNALLTFARAQSLPEPYHVLAHSMGGTIALRALIRGLPFQTAVFSAPMWGILIPAWQRPVAPALAAAACTVGLGSRYAPGTGPQTYVVQTPFAGNTLTTDPDMWAYMTAQAKALPRLSLGGPSFQWLHAALKECSALYQLASPETPSLCGLGSLERIVDPIPIRNRMARWPNSRLSHVEGAEHELLMERPILRDRFLAEAVAQFMA